MHAEKSGTDYSGVMADGRAHVAEAKTVKGMALPRARIQAKQAEQLDAVARAGGSAWLLVEFRDGASKLRCAIPWQKVVWTRRRTADVLLIEDAFKFAVPESECYLCPGVKVNSFAVRQRVLPRE